MHPMWASPRLVLFMELNPIYGFAIPLVSMMRGYVFFGLFRWALNFSSLCLWLAGRTILQPAYKEACCYGLDYLENDHVSCLYFFLFFQPILIFSARLVKTVTVIILGTSGDLNCATRNF